MTNLGERLNDTEAWRCAWHGKDESGWNCEFCPLFYEVLLLLLLLVVVVVVGGGGGGVAAVAAAAGGGGGGGGGGFGGGFVGVVCAVTVACCCSSYCDIAAVAFVWGGFEGGNDDGCGWRKEKRLS